MFRKMRRSKNQLSLEICNDILKAKTSGVLAVSGEDNYPYAVPLSFVHCGDSLYFHCALTGHKLDAITKNPKVSFCVIDQDQVVAEKYTTLYRSVIVFGKAHVITEEKEKRWALEQLAAKYSPDLLVERNQEIERQFEKVCMVELKIELITGKEALKS